MNYRQFESQQWPGQHFDQSYAYPTQNYGQMPTPQTHQQQFQRGPPRQEQPAQAASDYEVIMHIAQRLQEPQIRIVRAVADFLGSETALELLQRTEQVQAQGGMIVPETGKPRTNGGVYYRMLKDATDLPRDAQFAALERIKAEGKGVRSWEKASAPQWS